MCDEEGVAVEGKHCGSYDNPKVLRSFYIKVNKTSVALRYKVKHGKIKCMIVNFREIKICRDIYAERGKQKNDKQTRLISTDYGEVANRSDKEDKTGIAMVKEDFDMKKHFIVTRSQYGLASKQNC